MPPPMRVGTRRQLRELSRELNIPLGEWHDLDKVNVTATTHGREFEDAYESSVGVTPDYMPDSEMYVAIYRGEPGVPKIPVALVNLAMLFAWATEYEGD